ncbi:uncharacterized protein LOC115923015 [Strongylocentrotus purpuratus]|uniref:Uncharacterized protein n=1 Tax=Strongylocentrotus purpuratus TaxID=7668 RepID=A0A7M7SXN1_STRPU|nr:uncharacterized protein LOC100892147 [Strongylocentrotus purpuratus]XP_030838863.1 uncharacterized protein LOC115923015 [Strongylocentrotus purpuratus]|eukprot:XP_003726001.1 PREDICTED: uncharacterized protein LOC100892147 [Strongylocentrotus purpuratus]
MSPDFRYIFLSIFLVVLVSHTTFARGRQCPPRLSLLCAGGVGKRDGGLSQNTMSKNAETFRKDFLLDSLEGFRLTVCPFDSVIEQFSKEQQLELWQMIEDFAVSKGLDLR